MIESLLTATPDQLRKELEEKFGYNPEELKTVRKGTLVNLYKAESKKYVESVKLKEEGGFTPMVLDPPPPDMNDEIWNDYVLSKFISDELFEGKPKLDGLRRVTEKLLGKIIESNCKVVQAPSDGNPFATVIHEVVIKTEDWGDVRYSAAVDVNLASLTKPFNKHLVAVADSRAEARALKRALKLKTIIAEEVEGTNDNDDIEKTNDDGVLQQQNAFVDLLCTRLSLNKTKLLEHLYQKSDLSDLEFEQRTDCIKTLTEWQRDTTKIPEELKV